jgi:hypothetical protein
MKKFVLSALRSVSTLVLGVCLAGCEQASDRLQGQTNLSTTFYGIAIDQDGTPLSGVRVEYQVDAYPDDWTFDTRDRPYVSSNVTAISDEAGRFKFDAKGCILRLKHAERTGYRHFFETDGSERNPSPAGYSLIAWGQQTYRPDPDNPAIFVFVREGINEVSVLPSVGGWHRGDTGGVRHTPKWPKRPSLPDVVYKPPATQPVQGQAEGG